MHPTKPILAAKTGYMLISLTLCALGVILIVDPGLSATLLCRLIGALLIGYGVFKLLGYFSKDLFRLAFQFDLAFGLLSAAVGLIMILRPARMISFINLVMGILVLSDGLFKIQIALDGRKFGIRKWWLIIALAVIAVSFGILLIIDPFGTADLLMIMLGISLLAEGILNFCVMLCTVKIIKNQYPDTLEAQWKEEQP